VFTKARHWTLSWASRIQFASSIPISLRSSLMLPSHLRLGPPSGLLHSAFPIKTVYGYIIILFHSWTLYQWQILRDFEWCGSNSHGPLLIIFQILLLGIRKITWRIATPSLPPARGSVLCRSTRHNTEASGFHVFSPHPLTTTTTTTTTSLFPPTLWIWSLDWN
jgi:hypothetical protein